MRKLKNIVISVLLIAVIAVGLSAAICAQNRSGNIQCAEAHGVFVPAKMPYVEVYARYVGVNMTSEFQTVVGLNYNNQGWQYAYGPLDYDESAATIIQQPAYNGDTFSWTHYATLS